LDDFAAAAAPDLLAPSAAADFMPAFCLSDAEDDLSRCGLGADCCLGAEVCLELEEDLAD